MKSPRTLARRKQRAAGRSLQAPGEALGGGGPAGLGLGLPACRVRSGRGSCRPWWSVTGPGQAAAPRQTRTELALRL